MELSQDVLATLGTALFSIITIVLSIILQFREQRRDLRLQNALTKVERQLAELYGPLLGFTRAGYLRAFFESSVQDGLIHRDECVVFPTNNMAVVRKWRTWVKAVFMPHNLEIENILRSKADLLIEEEYPQVFVHTLAHIAAYKGLVSTWEEDLSGDEGAMHRNTAHINFPPDLEDYVHDSFQWLKSEQKRLLDQLYRDEDQRGFSRFLYIGTRTRGASCISGRGVEKKFPNKETYNFSSLSSSTRASSSLASSLKERDATQKPTEARRMTENEVRNVIKSKFSTIIGNFRALDQNGDGFVSKTDFFHVLSGNGIELPAEQMEQLWRTADEDGTGSLQYQEFARKFASYKAFHSLHRHADYKADQQSLQSNQQPVDAASRAQKHAVICEEQNTSSWGIDSATTTAITTATDKLVKVDPAAVIVEDLDKQDNKQDETIMVSRDAEQMKIPLEDMTGDQIRAKLYKKHGTILNAFRQCNAIAYCDDSIDYEEFTRHLPTALGEAISQRKIEELWRAWDPDMSGDEIDMKEFTSQKCRKF